jgi:glucose/arabinose dehydrogenase
MHRPLAGSCAGALALCAAVLLAPRAHAVADVPTGFSDQLVASGFQNLSNFDFLPDGRVLAIEQNSGVVWLVDPTGVVPPDTVGVVPDVGPTGGENGLLGIAVDPRWPLKPYVYFHYNYVQTPNLHVTRFALTGDLAGTLGTGLDLDVASKRDILADLPDDFPMHNGGTLRFAPDSTLFVAVGDDNVPCSAQDLHQLRGKLLRLEVRGLPDGPGWAPDYQAITPSDNPFAGNPDPRARLVWAYGLRNPWSYDFDPTSGTIAIGDVGNSRYEEVDFATEGGRNFGWPLYEGPWRFEYPLCTYPDTSTLTAPVAWYEHTGGPVALIMGGIVYRHPGVLHNFPLEYKGDVFYAELYTSRLYRLKCANGTCTPAPPVPGQNDSLAWATNVEFPTRLRFGPDASLWYASGAGELRKIEADILLAAEPPARPALALAAFPVPATGAVRLSYRLPSAAPATLFVADARGRRVRSLWTGEGRAGEHVATWDATDDRGARVPAGVYFAAVQCGGLSETKRLVILAGER